MFCFREIIFKILPVVLIYRNNFSFKLQDTTDADDDNDDNNDNEDRDLFDDNTSNQENIPLGLTSRQYASHDTASQQDILTPTSSEDPGQTESASRQRASQELSNQQTASSDAASQQPAFLTPAINPVSPAVTVNNRVLTSHNDSVIEFQSPKRRKLMTPEKRKLSDSEDDSDVRVNCCYLSAMSRPVPLLCLSR